FTCPALLGVPAGPNPRFAYGAVTLCGPTFQTGSATEIRCRTRPHYPAGLPSGGLASSAFARHYSRNHGCFLFLRVLRCFTSPGSPPMPMDSAWDDAALPASGFPIRTSPDQSLVGGSPRLFAATHVLHRLSAPRHPPHALSSLVTLLLSHPRGDACGAASGPRSSLASRTFSVRSARSSLRLPLSPTACAALPRRENPDGSSRPQGGVRGTAAGVLARRNARERMDTSSPAKEQLL